MPPRANRSAPQRPQGQAPVIDFLSRASAYDPPPSEVGRIETHASLVFLTDDRAYKVKRAVRYPFLDFSTLEKRRLACLNELKVNRRTAPDIYEDAVPITWDAEAGLALAGRGEPVEWAVRMRRFDQADLYDRMAREGRLPLDAMPPLADAIADLHASADRVLDADGMRAGLERLIAENESDMGGQPGVYEGDSVRALSQASRERLAADAPLLRSRAQGGFVRHCHGDLHLRNIVAISGKPVLFDAVEFDDAIATVDVLHDLAFLLMDLWARGLEAHANALLNRYLARTETAHLAGLALLPLFLSARAAIRSKAEALRADQVSGEQARGESIDAAASYFALARAFLRPARPVLVAVGGLSGTGKSTLARALAFRLPPAPGAAVLRSDVERKRQFAVDETEKLPPRAYRPGVSDRVYRAMRKKAGLVAGAGHSVIVDAVHATAEERAAIEDVARAQGLAFAGFWLEAPAETLIARVGARRGDASDADADAVRAQLQWNTGPIGWHRIDAGRPVEHMAAECLRAALKSD